MQVKQYLKQAYRLNELIECNKQELTKLRLLVHDVSGINYSQERVQTSPSGEAAFTRIITKIIELEKAINNDIEQMLSLKLEMRKTINDVKDNEEKLLLKYRYLNFETWDNICDKMNISKRTAFRIHNEALANVRVPLSFLKTLE